ncbi:MAG: hypothetical protein N2C13_00825 [Chloroflexota bacterium]
MTLYNISIFGLLALILSVTLKHRGRKWVLLVGSVLAIYWLQPALPIRNLDFWLPTATIFLTVLIYFLTGASVSDFTRENRQSALVLAGTILAIGLTRYIAPICCLTATLPPQLPTIFISIVILALLVSLVQRISKGGKTTNNIAFAAIIVVFIVLKNEELARIFAIWLRSSTGQSLDLALANDIQWLGFSYVAFRLLHTIRDHMSGRLPALSLSEFVTFVIFFPAFTAGPIDKVQRFLGNLRKEYSLSAEYIQDAGTRLVVGIFKKFVVADTLALIALNPQNAEQANSSFWTWILLIAYSLRIYFDFSGYTDIAIGLAKLLGINLPENFNRPYLQSNLTAFWNSWHMTLAQWFRAYFFNPFTRAMRAAKIKFPMPIIILSGQMLTMVLIGLWHGITWNFVIWGAWHGLGLFFHNRWANFAKSRLLIEDYPIYIQKLSATAGTLTTFLFVSIGWIWFTLPTPSQSWSVLKLLLRIS